MLLFSSDVDLARFEPGVDFTAAQVAAVGG
jgi:hypothetical protein